ncbi:hypothetical protein [Methylobacter sp. BBA5.1]|jgi:hypothetical protein|uniref:hypothetical protein n=1 Tax=Methylobacter sp. BBA5.1 TaxID=1495064 RepID=UPI00036D331C|nr:hypothetical protein [Methylobacter sp. BBA5.1]
MTEIRPVAPSCPVLKTDQDKKKDRPAKQPPSKEKPTREDQVIEPARHIDISI